MDPAHLHLLVNHLPVLGTALAVPLVLLALWRRREPWVLGGAVLLLLAAAGGAVVAQASGAAAEQAVEQLPGVTEAQVHEHAARADVATPLVVATGLVAAGLLGWSLRRGEVHPVAGGVLLLLTLGTAGAMAWVAQAGGPIRHSELRSGPIAASLAE